LVAVVKELFLVLAEVSAVIVPGSDRVRLKSIVGVAKESFFLFVCATKVLCFVELVSSFFVTHICSIFERIAIQSRHFQFEMYETFLYSLARYSLQVML